MFCKGCRQEKLRREFPFETLTEECDHAPLHCLRCVTHSVKNASKCPQCSQDVAADNPRYCEFVETLERLFPDSPHLLLETTYDASQETNLTISIVMLGGDCTVLQYHPDMTVRDLKISVGKRLGYLPEKQRLLYKDMELKSCANSRLLTLEDYNVEPFSTLYLIILLYAIPDALNEVVFDLFWGYPPSRCDFLDASVLIYNRSSLQGIVDFSRRSFVGVAHSGDVMDHVKRIGHHTINVKLKDFPSNIDKLFFTLSAWNSPNISSYLNPSLRFFDAKKPNKQLCSDQMEHAAYSQAIIMCSLSKIDGVWNVFSLRTLSAGNAKNYLPLQQTIGGIITQGLC
ncbi:uncharacterized protein LOC111339739 [Stylophora pistillata]|uniref:Ubiquitin-like domain-containing protein n=1 Tax=Stylophora pistillata TaxID=50429 RepID=A0A2B4RPW7_STYPI|nr:uncharacterized protein LOC111339739 [Stylophora pistillata]XP_022802194.1 uncharacterized protein LOC111339739 [Stylophora pistillata]XP_022802195.1 uncharacterized protein LOC111339739 [Stylophora pistillata]PFX18305.1 hypothetical protein AWC38_SpisGene17331 [Stylophora pistillata]